MGGLRSGSRNRAGGAPGLALPGDGSTAGLTLLPGSKTAEAGPEGCSIWADLGGSAARCVGCCRKAGKRKPRRTSRRALVDHLASIVVVGLMLPRRRRHEPFERGEVAREACQ